MADDKRVRQVVERQTKITASLTELMISQLVALWGAFDAWYDEDLVRARAARSATIVEAGQRQMRLRQGAYLRFIFRQLQVPFPQVPAPVFPLYPRIGITPDDVWLRPAEQYRYHRSIGETADQALDAAVNRATVLADTEASLARRDESQKVFKASARVTGYRRIIHPELSKTGTCGLCVVAADRTYSIDELLPIHDFCNCGVLPVTEDSDPGLNLNQDDLEKLYAEAGGTGAGGLLNVRYVINDHGELGPVLTNAEHKFTDRAGRERDSTVRPRKKGGQRGVKSTAPNRDLIVAAIATYEDRIPRVRARIANGEDVGIPLEWELKRLAHFREQLRKLDAS